MNVSEPAKLAIPAGCTVEYTELSNPHRTVYTVHVQPLRGVYRPARRNRILGVVAVAFPVFALLVAHVNLADLNVLTFAVTLSPVLGFVALVFAYFQQAGYENPQHPPTTAPVSLRFHSADEAQQWLTGYGLVTRTLTSQSYFPVSRGAVKRMQEGETLMERSLYSTHSTSGHLCVYEHGTLEPPIVLRGTHSPSPSPSL